MSGHGKELSRSTAATSRVTKRTATASGKQIESSSKIAHLAGKDHVGLGHHDEPNYHDDPHSDVLEEGIDDQSSGATTFGHDRNSARARRRSFSSTTDWLLNGPAPGGPQNHELLQSFKGHVAYLIWEDDRARAPLRIHSRINSVHKLPSDKDIGDAFGLIDGTGLMHLRQCMYMHHNAPLISAFVERWHPETNSFHLPFGEMTITLHDVLNILSIPIDGNECKSVDFSSDSDAVGFLASIVNLPADVFKAKWLKSMGMTYDDILHFLEKGNLDADNYARLYLWYLLSATLFIDKSSHRAPVSVLRLVADLGKVGQMAMGAGALAYLYRQLGKASRSGCSQLAGCSTLLEAWIYEYFPAFRRSMVHRYRVGQPRAMRWDTTRQHCHSESMDHLLTYRRRIDGMQAREVDFLPFRSDVTTSFPITLYTGGIHYLDIVEPYMPDRIMRQFGYIQHIPRPPVQPSRGFCRGLNVASYKADYSSIGYNWSYKYHHLLKLSTASRLCVYQHDTVDGYLEWFRERTHPYVHCAVEGEPTYDSSAHLLTDAERYQAIMGGLRSGFKDVRRGESPEIVLSRLEHMYYAMGGLEFSDIDDENEEQQHSTHNVTRNFQSSPSRK